MKLQTKSDKNCNLPYRAEKQQQDALFSLTHILAESATLREAAPKILQTICKGFDWELGELWCVDFDSDLLRLEDIWHVASLEASEFVELSRKTTFAPGIGLPGRAWVNGQPAIWINDVLTDSNFPRAPVAAKAGLHGAVAFPLTERGKIVGVIVFFSKRIKPQDKNTYHTIADIGIRIGSFMSQKKAEELLHASEHKYRTILEATIDFVCTFNADGRIIYINKGGRKLIGIDEAENFLHLSISDCYSKWMYDAIVNNAVSTAASKDIWVGEAVLQCRDGREIPVLQVIIVHKNLQGTVEYYSVIARDITERMKLEKELKKSLEDLQKTLDGTIEAIALMCEVRDPYTSGHEKRVAQLACAIAEEIGLSEDKRKGVHVSAFLHDIGKIAAPSEILCKPSELSVHEYSIVKTHSEVGYSILKNVKFPWPVAQIVLQHHEMLDGSGYPAGLKGEEILMEARVIAVADTVEAMVNHRPYRPALGINYALREISRNRGVLYDPKVVDACIKIFKGKWDPFVETYSNASLHESKKADERSNLNV